MTLDDKLIAIYGAQAGRALAEAVYRRVGRRKAPTGTSEERRARAATTIGPDDAALICYADSIVAGDSCSPLRALDRLLRAPAMDGAFSILHLLPFFPWDTDRGFSVMDYRQVDPHNGSWDDVERLAERARLMFDLVMNHASIDNPLVQGALIERHLPADDKRRARYESYAGLVLAYAADQAPSAEQLAQTTRPRPHKLLTPYLVFEDANGALRAQLGRPEDLPPTGKLLGSGLVWTTFSRPEDERGRETTRQVDLNFAQPATFLAILDICLLYAERGCRLLRLDAVAYLWKRLGGRSIHEPETHRLLSALVDALALAHPELLTVGEINEPQASGFSYLGDQAHLVYQFAHFPLAVYGLRNGDAAPYNHWLGSMQAASGRQFITLLGSHDGMGLKPVRDGLLNDDQLDRLVEDLESQGALCNFAQLPGGRRIVYEVCGTAWFLLNAGIDDEELALRRFMTLVSVGMIPRGLPAFYINGLLARENYAPTAGLDENRSINREQLGLDELLTDLADPDHRSSRALDGIRRMLEIRAQEPAFSPWGPEPIVLELDPRVLAARLQGVDHRDREIVVVASFSAEVLRMRLPLDGPLNDLLSDRTIAAGEVELQPFETLWLRKLG